MSRTALVSDLSSKGVVNLVSDEVRQIYSLLEADFTPLELCQRLAPLLKQLESVTKPMSGMSSDCDSSLHPARAMPAPSSPSEGFMSSDHHYMLHPSKAMPAPRSPSEKLEPFIQALSGMSTWHCHDRLCNITKLVYQVLLLVQLLRRVMQVECAALLAACRTTCEDQQTSRAMQRILLNCPVLLPSLLLTSRQDSEFSTQAGCMACTPFLRLYSTA